MIHGHRPPKEPDLFPLNSVNGLKRGEKTFVRREIYHFHHMDPVEFQDYYRQSFRFGGIPSMALMSIYGALVEDFRAWAKAWEDYDREIRLGRHCVRP